MNDVIPNPATGDILVMGRHLGPSMAVEPAQTRSGWSFRTQSLSKSIFDNVAYGLRINGMGKSREKNG